MLNKTIAHIQKQRLQEKQQDVQSLSRESIRIPFFNYSLKRQLPINATVFSQQPHYSETLKQKKRLLLERLSNHQLYNFNQSKMVNKSVQVQQATLKNRYQNQQQNAHKKIMEQSKIKSLQISGRSKQSFKNNNQHKIKINKFKSEPNSQQGQSSYDSDLKKMQKISLPLITVSQVKQRNKEKSTRRKKQLLRMNAKKQKQKKKVLKKCYISESLKQQSQARSNKRIKTDEQVENEYMVKKIILVKPSDEVNRTLLKNRYEDHQYYKKIRQRKSPIFSPKTFLLCRSRSGSPNLKQFIKL